MDAQPSHTADSTAASLTGMLHALSLYVAAGIASLGWALCEVAGWQSRPWVPLWFCAALLVYNADRLSHDPADAVNVPRRAAASARFRRAGIALIAAAALVLVALPIVQRDWLTLALVLAGAAVCLNYSRPLLGFRFKDLPLVKTLFVPTVAAAALVGLPWLHEGSPSSGGHFAIVALRAWTLMFFNTVLCDLRDIEGDRRNGIVSIPGALGAKRTRVLLWLLLVVLEVLAFTALAAAPPAMVRVWQIVCVFAPLYLGALLLALRTPRTERFYEWWVEGILFLPAISLLTAQMY